jgi:hypothetical protein
MSQAEPEAVSKSRDLPLRWWPQVTALLLILVELCWVLPWYRMVLRVGYVATLPRAALILGGIMLAGYSLASSMESLRLLRGLQVGIQAVLLVASLLLAEALLLNSPGIRIINGLVNLDPGAVLVLLAVLWMWWRGVALARETIRPLTAWRRFELSLLMFIAYLLIIYPLGGETPGLGWFIFFLFIGFLAVIFARVSYVGIAKGVGKNPFDRRWLWSTVGILGLAIALSATLGSLLTGQYLLLLELLAEGFKLLVAIVLFILAIPALILSQVIGPFEPWLRSAMTRPTPTPQAGESPVEAYLTAMQASAPPIFLFVQSLLFWGIILLLVVLLYMRVRRNLNIASRRVLEEPESLLGRGDARKLLRKALQDAMEGLTARLRPAQRWLAAARIRQIYANLMKLCADLGVPRLPANTPLEFLTVMGGVFSTLIQDLEMITQAYMRIRYGEYPETVQEVAEVEAAWQHLAEEGQRLKKAGWRKLQATDKEEAERPEI